MNPKADSIWVSGFGGCSSVFGSIFAIEWLLKAFNLRHKKREASV
jgi:hypothetical protein